MTSSFMIRGSRLLRSEESGIQQLHSLEVDPWVFTEQSLTVSHPGVGEPLVPLAVHQRSNSMGKLYIYISY